MAYDHDYPTEPIGDGNPYYRCAHCKRPDPEINGDIKKHDSWCLYRRQKEGGQQDEALIRQMLDAMERVIDWDKARDCSVPYRVRDPIHAAIAAARARLGEKDPT